MSRLNSTLMSPSPDSRISRESVTRRVLVVDDEPTLRLGFAYALATSRTVVETAGTGRQALDKLAVNFYDIVILDLRMPDIDGLGVIERLHQEGSQVPVVLCTAALTPNAVLRAIQCRVVDFLMKPVRPIDLRSVINFVLQPAEQAQDQAMKLARQGNLEGAIHRLSKAPASDLRSAAWLELFRLVHMGGEDLEEIATRKLDRGGLSALAFRAPANGTQLL
jgi:DNA-binding NtrC family response regulator